MTPLPPAEQAGTALPVHPYPATGSLGLSAQAARCGCISSVASWHCRGPRTAKEGRPPRRRRSPGSHGEVGDAWSTGSHSPGFGSPGLKARRRVQGAEGRFREGPDREELSGREACPLRTHGCELTRNWSPCVPSMGRCHGLSSPPVVLRARSKSRRRRWWMRSKKRASRIGPPCCEEASEDPIRMFACPTSVTRSRSC